MGNKSSKGKDLVEAKFDPIWRAPNMALTDQQLATDHHLTEKLLEVWLLGNSLTHIPKDNSWSALQVLYLNDNQVSNAINEFLSASGRNLEEVNLSGNPLSNVDGLAHCTSITQLYLNNLPQLQVLPEELTSLSNLVVFQANETALQSLPSGGDYWPKLKQLSLTDNKKLTTLPECSWPLLQKLFLHRCSLVELPSTLSSMTSLTKLYFNDNPSITTLPTLPTSVDELYFASCDISELPASILELTSLKFIMGENNKRLAALPPGLLSLPALEIAHFNSCALGNLGGDFGRKVAFIHLAGNNLSELPFESLVALRGKLRKFEIENNPVCESHQSQVDDILDNLVVNN